MKLIHTLADSAGDISIPDLFELECGELQDRSLSNALTWVGTGMGSDWFWACCMGSVEGLLGLATLLVFFLKATDPARGSTLTTWGLARSLQKKQQQI